jgi:hypothetical protein
VGSDRLCGPEEVPLQDVSISGPNGNQVAIFDLVRHPKTASLQPVP